MSFLSENVLPSAGKYRNMAHGCDKTLRKTYKTIDRFHINLKFQ